MTAPAAVTGPAGAAAPAPVLSADGLVKIYPPAGQRGQPATALAKLSLLARRGQLPRRGRRERLRQVNAGPAAHRPGTADRRHGPARGPAAERLPPARTRPPAPARLPGPVLLAEPAADGRQRADRGPPRPPPGAGQGRGPRPGCGTARHGVARAAVRRPPAARDVRRAGAAGGDRPGARGRAADPHPGRADVGPGRVGPGRHREPAGPAAFGAGALVPVHQPRHGGDPAAQRPDRGHVPGPVRGARAVAVGHVSAAAPVHPGAAGRGARAAAGRQPAGRDGPAGFEAGCTAEPMRQARRASQPFVAARTRRAARSGSAGA